MIVAEGVTGVRVRGEEAPRGSQEGAVPVWGRARQRKLAASPRRWKVLEGVEHRNIHSFIHQTSSS